MHHQEAPEDKKEEPAAEHEEDEEVQGEPVDTEETPRVSSSGRGEKRTETRECVREKTSDDEITEAAGHTCLTS